MNNKEINKVLAGSSGETGDDAEEENGGE